MNAPHRRIRSDLPNAKAELDLVKVGLLKVLV